MSVLEPNEFTLWTHVKAKAPWPRPDESTLETLGGDWAKAAQEYAEAGSFSLSGLDAVWPDGVGKDFVTRSQRDLDATYDVAQLMARQSERATRFAGEVKSVKDQIRSLIQTNEPKFLQNLRLPAGVAKGAVEGFVNGIAGEVNRIVNEAAGRISSDTRAPLPQRPKAGATPEENADYWRKLPLAERLRLAREDPNFVGKADGFSAAERDIANRVLLDQERDRLSAELATLDATQHRGPGAHIAEQQANDRRAEILGKLKGIDDIQRNLNMSTNDDNSSRMYLLGINGHEDGKAIVARGNPDTAANVATFVPGVGSDLRTINNNLGNSDALHRAAIRSGSESTSVITWVDFDPPNTIVPEGINPLPAAAATDELDEFQHGLRASHLGPQSHNTVVGHSYGSTVAGAAANDENLPIDDLVAVGSPGLGYDVSDAADLNLPEEHVWVGEHRNDWVADSGAMGSMSPFDTRDPSEPSFGARGFLADRDPNGPVEYTDFGAHDRYFREDIDNPALTNMGDIIAGREPTQK